MWKEGYTAQDLETIIEEVHQTSLDLCLVDRIRPIRAKHEWGFISDFHVQNREVEFLSRKYWNVLQMDKVLKGVLQKNPVFLYRKAPSFDKSREENP